MIENQYDLLTEVLLLTPVYLLFTHQPRGKTTGIGFSKVKEKLGYGISAYIPQISLPKFEYPLLACDISTIEQNLIGWEDTVNGMDAHNLIYDIPRLMDTKEPLFSLVKQWSVDAKDNATGEVEDLDADASENAEEESDDSNAPSDDEDLNDRSFSC